MEEDLEVLERALINLETSQSQKDNASNYEGLYKNWGKLGNQEERRTQLLEIQKSNRNNKIDGFRGILEIVNAVEDNKIFKTRKINYRPNIYVAGFNKTSLSYSNVLMLSEWMVEKPGDFSENWFVVPCPKGMRTLVISKNGTTKFYTKYGRFKFELHTGLPGGNPHNKSRNGFCIFDCFYYEDTKSLYLLDLIAWNNQPMTDGETEFRQYWMKTHLEELPETKTMNDRNKVVIEVLPMMPCTDQSLTSLLSKYPQFDDNKPPMDGLLFYHKQAHYIAGETPLVGWLYPFMVPEVLGEGIKLHPGYLEEAPIDYVNQADFIKKFEVQHRKNKDGKHRRRRCKSSEMETDCNKTEDITETDTSILMDEEEKIDEELDSKTSESMNT